MCFPNIRWFVCMGVTYKSAYTIYSVHYMHVYNTITQVPDMIQYCIQGNLHLYIMANSVIRPLFRPSKIANLILSDLNHLCNQATICCPKGGWIRMIFRCNNLLPKIHDTGLGSVYTGCIACQANRQYTACIT